MHVWVEQFGLGPSLCQTHLRFQSPYEDTVRLGAERFTLDLPEAAWTVAFVCPWRMATHLFPLPLTTSESLGALVHSR